jgi:dTDP-4-amino-4,6-dideoxygalactose transaminase
MSDPSKRCEDEEGLRKALAARYGREDAALTACGAAALEVALAHLGVKVGDEVIVPDNACHRVGAGVLRVGATPVFTHVDKSLVLGPDAVAAAMSPKTACVIVVHQYGLPAPIDQLRAGVPDDIWLVEDVAQAWDTKRDGAVVGSAGALAVTSFGPTKPLRVGAGGAVLCASGELETKVSDIDVRERGFDVPPLPAPFPSPLLGSLGDAIPKADLRVATRREFVREATDALEAAGLRAHQAKDGEEPSWHRLPVWADDEAARDRFLRACAERGISAQGPQSQPTPKLPMFRHARQAGNGGEERDSRLALLQADGDDGVARLRAALAQL